MPALRRYLHPCMIPKHMGMSHVQKAPSKASQVISYGNASRAYTDSIGLCRVSHSARLYMLAP